MKLVLLHIEYHKTLRLKPWGFLFKYIKEVIMTIERLETKLRMSRIVKHNGTVYLCGQVCADATQNITEQTQTMLDKVETLLIAAGSSKKHMLSATIYLKTMADFAQMNAVWDAWAPDGYAPARACVQAAMARDVLLVEISVVAALIQ
ncbi:MAG: enamine deaminase RidA (YjgF/YER057c/UK114 family) [Cognaticolwellia sp.]